MRLSFTPRAGHSPLVDVSVRQEREAGWLDVQGRPGFDHSRDPLLQLPAGETVCLPGDFLGRSIMRPRTETRAQMIRDPLDEPDQQDDPKADGEQRAQEREEDHECDKEHGYDDSGRGEPVPKENGSRIASISSFAHRETLPRRRPPGRLYRGKPSGKGKKRTTGIEPATLSLGS